MAITRKLIDKELQSIYDEMTSWRETKKRSGYVISEEEVSRRELFLIGREELYKLEDAKKAGDRLAVDLHEATYDLIKATLALY